MMLLTEYVGIFLKKVSKMGDDDVAPYVDRSEAMGLLPDT